MTYNYSGIPQKNKVLSKNKDLYGSTRNVPTIELFETTEDMNIWVSTSGFDDRRGNGTEFLPYATLTRALQDVPFRINHKVHIRMAAGTYDETVTNMTYSYGTDGMLIIEGIGTPVATAGPYTVSSWGSEVAANNCCCHFTLSGAPLVEDELWGKWVRVKTGTAVGRIFPVFTNTTDKIRTNTFSLGSSTISEIEIVDDPATVLNFSKSLCIAGAAMVKGGSIAPGKRADYSRLIIAGVKFNMTADLIFPLSFVNVVGMLQFVTFQGVDPATVPWDYTLHIYDSEINTVTPIESGVLDNTLFEDEDGGGVMCKRGTSPWTGGFASSTTIEKSNVSRLTDRLRVYVWEKCILDESCVSHVYTQKEAYLWTDRLLVDAANDGSTSHGISIDGGRLATYRVYVESTAGDGIRVTNGGFAEIYNVDGNAANIAGHGVKVDTMGRVLRYTVGTITGVFGDTVFNMTSTTNAWPSSGNSVEDGLGSIITTV